MLLNFWIFFKASGEYWCSLLVKNDERRQFSHTNKLHTTLHGVGGLLSENCKTGRKAGSFYRIKNKEQGSQCRAQGWLGTWELAEWIYCVSGQVERFGGHESYLRVGLLKWHPGQEWVHLRSRNFFQPCSSRQSLSRLPVMSCFPWPWFEHPFHSHSLCSAVLIRGRVCEWHCLGPRRVPSP